MKHQYYIKKRFKKAVLFMVFLCGLAACESTSTLKPQLIAPATLTSLNRYERGYVLSPGDRIEVNVYRFPEISRVLTVRIDGFISLPLLDDVKAGGLTIKELDDNLTAKLDTRLRNPEVTVIVENAIEPMVYVLGDASVVKPVPVREAKTVAQAIAHAHGFTRDAAWRDVALIRLDKDGYLRAHKVDLNHTGQPALYMALQNMAVQADDLIIIPESNRSQSRRLIRDFITTPLAALNQILSPYFQFKLISEIES